MKTKNNVQKAILRWAAVVVSFVLISFTVSAQDFWKRLIENSSFNDIAIAMVETPVEAKPVEAPAESLEAMYFENEVETEMVVEDWMTDNSTFDVNVFQYEVELETELGVEEWMMDENLFQSEIETEGSLELETWMTSEKVWNI
jgi:hypothetical protein